MLVHQYSFVEIIVHLHSTYVYPGLFAICLLLYMYFVDVLLFHNICLVTYLFNAMIPFFYISKTLAVLFVISYLVHLFFFKWKILSNSVAILVLFSKYDV
uniref:Uncharacterized protein n=1 Tax=Cacopsylla melanoneura TaxID=428564 RepID=A0A8D8VT78_9HEMI